MKKLRVIVTDWNGSQSVITERQARLRLKKQDYDRLYTDLKVYAGVLRYELETNDYISRHCGG